MSGDARKRFSPDEARRVGEEIGIDWASARFDVDEFRRGLNIELEHGRLNPATNVTDDDPTLTGRIALAHLNGFPDYYTRLEAMEASARRRRDEPPLIQPSARPPQRRANPQHPVRPSDLALHTQSSATHKPAPAVAVLAADHSVLRWRLDQLLGAGYDPADAELLARHGEVDLHFAINLVRRGCPPGTAHRILL